jgi:hypothetical protein
MTEINFNVTKDENAVIMKIARRAREMAANHGRENSELIDIVMDITAAHASGNPLRLEALLEADDFNFAHDVFGIARHLDRSTGELRDFFTPRFSQRQSANAA